jgi:hypothetical protein
MAHEWDLLRATQAQARGPAGTILEMAHAIVTVLQVTPLRRAACPPAGHQQARPRQAAAR